MWRTGAKDRDVYLQPGLWIDYQGGAVYEGAGWHHLRAGGVPVLPLAREGAAVPHAKLAQSTDRMDWGRIEPRVFGAQAAMAEGLVCLPEGGDLHNPRLARGRRLRAAGGPFRG